MMEVEELKTFFGEEIEVKDKNKPETEIEEIEPDDKRKKVLNAINLTRYIFAIIASVFFTAYIFYNSDFDFNPPEEVACEVIDMPKHEDKNGNVTYYLVVMYGDKEIKTEVGEITYNECMVGGEVTLLRYGGAFGIQTLYLG